MRTHILRQRSATSALLRLQVLVACGTRALLVDGVTLALAGSTSCENDNPVGALGIATVAGTYWGIPGVLLIAFFA